MLFIESPQIAALVTSQINLGSVTFQNIYQVFFLLLFCVQTVSFYFPVTKAGLSVVWSFNVLYA